jgi:hypothetical protein
MKAYTKLIEVECVDLNALGSPQAFPSAFGVNALLLI